MKITIVEPRKEPYIADVENELRALQGVVGGYIETVSPFEDPVLLVCDEEGIWKNYPFNRRVGHGMQIFGTFFLCGVDGEEFADMPEELIDKYTDMFGLKG